MASRWHVVRLSRGERVSVGSKKGKAAAESLARALTRVNGEHATYEVEERPS